MTSKQQHFAARNYSGGYGCIVQIKTRRSIVHPYQLGNAYNYGIGEPNYPVPASLNLSYDLFFYENEVAKRI